MDNPDRPLRQAPAVGDTLLAMASLEGQHWIHLYERGDCSDTAGKSMGGHFSPQDQEHAPPSETSARHLGDLDNIQVNPEGEGRLEITTARLARMATTTVSGYDSRCCNFRGPRPDDGQR